MDPRPRYFRRDTAGAAARQLRRATGLFLGSLVAWALLVGGGGVGTLEGGWGSLAVATGVLVEVLVFGAFVGAVLEYLTWVTEALGGD